MTALGGEFDLDRGRGGLRSAAFGGGAFARGGSVCSAAIDDVGNLRGTAGRRTFRGCGFGMIEVAARKMVCFRSVSGRERASLVVVDEGLSTLFTFTVLIN
jgi:hypothetical protein